VYTKLRSGFLLFLLRLRLLRSISFLAAAGAGPYTPATSALSLNGLSPMNDVTRILSAIEQGDPQAAAQLLPLVYDELRRLAAQKLAQEKPGQTLDATALVHEAYLRLVGGDGAPQWDGRGHFFAAAAEAMRRILVETARRKRRRKHGAGRSRQDLDAGLITAPEAADDLLALDEALTRLATTEPQVAKLVPVFASKR
jgi:RNA polymerase sigma factor (TIGR02999 family)